MTVPEHGLQPEHPAGSTVSGKGTRATLVLPRSGPARRSSPGGDDARAA